LLLSIILATPEAEIRKIMVQIQHRQIVRENTQREQDWKSGLRGRAVPSNHEALNSHTNATKKKKLPCSVGGKNLISSPSPITNNMQVGSDWGGPWTRV
jgi:hypothetical protein